MKKFIYLLIAAWQANTDCFVLQHATRHGIKRCSQCPQLTMADQKADVLKKVIVFGATGKVGSAVCKALIAEPKGVECHAFVRNVSQAKDLLGPDAILHEGDLSDFSTVQEAMVT